jgi:hypothetical protein
MLYFWAISLISNQFKRIKVAKKLDFLKSMNVFYALDKQTLSSIFDGVLSWQTSQKKTWSKKFPTAPG